MLFFWLACPGCGRNFDFHLGDYDFYRFLGPPRYLCPNCGAVYSSDRTEWADLSLIGKLLWLVCSGLLVAGTGLLGGLSVMFARHLLYGGAPDPNIGMPFHQDRTFWIAFAAWAGVTLALQSWRLIASVRRSAAPSVPFRATFFNLQVSLAPKYAFSYVIPPLVCGLYGLVNGP
jgi:hypothetical protein